MNYNITELVKALCSVIVAIIVTFVIPYIKERVDSEKLSKVQKWVKIAVEAAEQIYRTSGSGKSKKVFVEEFLKNKGITLDSAEIDLLIESSVLEMNKALGGE